MTIARRTFLQTSIAAAALPKMAQAQAPPPPPRATEFKVACMTLPYSQFPFLRALAGLRHAGYRYVALGTSHLETAGQKPAPILSTTASADDARDVAKKCRDLGLEPLMMFATVYPDGMNGLEVHRQRILQAAAAGIPQLLTFARNGQSDVKMLVERLKQLAPLARDNNVTVVFKQHGGNTGTGEECAAIVREVDHPNIRLNYDAGNVMDYTQGKVNPLADLEKCVNIVHSFCIKDHRRGPTRSADCGPGLGEIDHYRLLNLVSTQGRTISLCCENISAPGVARPTRAEDVDALARRAREFLELVIRGLQP